MTPQPIHAYSRSTAHLAWRTLITRRVLLRVTACVWRAVPWGYSSTTRNHLEGYVSTIAWQHRYTLMLKSITALLATPTPRRWYVFFRKGAVLPRLTPMSLLVAASLVVLARLSTRLMTLNFRIIRAGFGLKSLCLLTQRTRANLVSLVSLSAVSPYLTPTK